MPTVARNPRCIRALHEPESSRLRKQYPKLTYTVTECVTCRGTGTFRWRDPESGEPVEWTCNCSEQFKLHRYLLHSGVRLNYQRLGWADAVAIPEDVRAIADEYRDNAQARVDAGLGLMFYGPPGTGKTLLATLLTKALLASGWDAYFTTLDDMIDRFAEGWSSDDDRVWFERRIRNASFLVVDDLGRERDSKITEKLLDRVFRSRVADMLPTIVTTNKEATDISSIYSDYVASLLSEVTEPYLVPGVDYRRTASQNRRAESDQQLTRPIVLT